MKERKIQSLEGIASALAIPKAVQGKKSSSFAMYVDNKLKQIDARSYKITKKGIIDILFEVQIGTTCVTSAQRQHSISIRSAEALQHLFKSSIRGVRRKLKTSDWICFLMTDCILF